MDDRARRAFERLERARDQVLARLHKHFDRHIVGNARFVDQLANEIEVGLRCGRKSDFDFLEADRHEHLEEFELLWNAHRLDQRLVAVAQVGAHPDRRSLDRAARPFAAVQPDGGEGAVLLGRIAQHDGWPCSFSRMRWVVASSGWPDATDARSARARSMPALGAATNGRGRTRMSGTRWRW